MKLRLWPVLYLDLRNLRRRLGTNHHKPRASWKDARPDFQRFDWCIIRTEAILRVGEPKPRMPWRLWVYRKDAEGKVWARHVDWLWFPPRHFGLTVPADA